MLTHLTFSLCFAFTPVAALVRGTCKRLAIANLFSDHMLLPESVPPVLDCSSRHGFCITSNRSTRVTDLDRPRGTADGETLERILARSSRLCARYGMDTRGQHSDLGSHCRAGGNPN